jgi:RNase adaptor protein for sRNA GlmZ degradation
MSTLERPPSEIFCLTCGPCAVLERDPAASLLRCASCGAVTEVPALPLFVVTGASGVGKTTVIAPLRGLLPECEVFEGDPISQIAALGWDVFGDTWLRIAHGVALNGRSTVLCTSLIPSRLETHPARKLLGRIYFCNLDCPDDELAARLRARPPWRHSSTEEVILTHQRFAAWLREHIDPTWDTSTLTPDEAAERIAAWIRPQLRQTSH